ncbi:hypothetical protein REPUB_Repub03eG0277400 [Reevesia pubescens]
MHGGKELPKVFTVFVNNLPQRANQRWLSTIFQKFGRVVDVFIPLKRSKWGKKIAFVRFGSLNDANRAILNLNGVFFLDHRIGVNMARFNPRKEFWRKRESFKGKRIVHEGDVASGNYDAGPARVKGIERDINQQKPESQKSYLQVLLDADIGQAKKQESGAEGDNQSLSSQKVVEEEQDAVFCMGRIEEEKLHWLERSFIGRYNGALDLKNLAEEIKEEVSKSLTVRIFSGDEIIITFDNFEEFQRNRNNGWISFSKWLFNTRVWSEDLIGNRRNIWLACYGVPLHIWNLDTFQEIGSRWGDFIRLDNITMSPDSFTRGCMQITTSSFSRIDEVVKVKAGNFVYPVLVREVDPVLIREVAGPCCYEHLEKALQGIQMVEENGDHCSFSSSKLNGEDDKSLSIPKGGGSNGITEAGKLNVAESNYGEQDCEFMKMNKALHAANGEEAQSGSPGSNVPVSTEDDNEQLLDAVKSKEAMKNQKVHGTESQSLVDNDDGDLVNQDVGSWEEVNSRDNSMNMPILEEVEKAAEMENVAQVGRIEEHGQSGGHGPPSMGKELNVANFIDFAGIVYATVRLKGCIVGCCVLMFGAAFCFGSSGSSVGKENCLHVECVSCKPNASTPKAVSGARTVDTSFEEFLHAFLECQSTHAIREVLSMEEYVGGGGQEAALMFGGPEDTLKGFEGNLASRNSPNLTCAPKISALA